MSYSFPWRHVSSIVALAVTVSLNAYSQQGQGLPAATKLEESRLALREVIEASESTVSRDAFDARAKLVVTERNFKYLQSSWANRSVDQLTPTERNLLSLADQVHSEWGFGNQQLSLKAAGLSSNVAQALANSSPEGRSLVTGYAPTYRLSGSPEDVVLTVTGMGFDEVSPKLAFGSIPCELAASSNLRLEFRCSPGIFNGLNRVTSRVGDLSLHPKKKFWQVLAPDAAPTRYELEIIGVPARYASYSVRAVVDEQTSESQERSQYFEHTNSHCSGSTNLNWPVNASNGWRIVEASVRTSPTSVASGCSGPTATNITSMGFVVAGRAVNSGNCVKAFGQVISKDGRGWVKGHAYWTEVREVATKGTLEVEEGSLNWGQTVSVTLPPNATGFVVNLHTLTGQLESAEKVGDHGPYSVSYDSVSRVLNIRVAPLQAALRSAL